MSKGNIGENYELEEAGYDLEAIRVIVWPLIQQVHDIPGSKERTYVLENLQDLLPETE